MTVSRRLLTPREVAGMFRVSDKTVVRWAKSGRLPSFRTPGGHRRFYADQVEAMLLVVPPDGRMPGE